MPNCKEFRLNITQLFNNAGTLPQEQLFEKFDEFREEFETQRKNLALPFGKNEYGLVIKYWNKDDIQLWIYSDAVPSAHPLQQLAEKTCRRFNPTPGGYYEMMVSELMVEETDMIKVGEDTFSSKQVA